MALRGAVPLGAPPEPSRAKAIVRSRVQPWALVPLAWGDHRTRSLLLVATTLCGVFAGYALPSMLSQPADFSTVMSLRQTSWMLFALGLIVAPALTGHRVIACFSLLLHILASIARTYYINGDLPQPVTYGLIDAFRFASVGALVLYWMILRMRHPINAAVTSAVFCLVFGAFFLYGTIWIRNLVVGSDGLAEQFTSHDESYIWTITAVAGVALLVLSARMDAYWRSVVPMWGAEYLGARNPLHPAAREDVERHFVMAWVFFALFLDVVAMYFVARALKHPLALSGDKEWYARVLLRLCSARIVIALHVLTMLCIVALNPEYRSLGAF